MLLAHFNSQLRSLLNPKQSSLIFNNIFFHPCTEWTLARIRKAPCFLMFENRSSHAWLLLTHRQLTQRSCPTKLSLPFWRPFWQETRPGLQKFDRFYWDVADWFVDGKVLFSFRLCTYRVYFCESTCEINLSFFVATWKFWILFNFIKISKYWQTSFCKAFSKDVQF